MQSLITRDFTVLPSGPRTRRRCMPSGLLPTGARMVNSHRSQRNGSKIYRKAVFPSLSKTSTYMYASVGQWSQLPRSTWRGYRGPSRARSRGGSLEGLGKGRLWRKYSRKGRSRRAARQCALIPSFLPVNMLVNLITVNQMGPYDSDNSDGDSEFPLTKAKEA